MAEENDELLKDTDLEEEDLEGSDQLLHAEGFPAETPLVEDAGPPTKKVELDVEELPEELAREEEPEEEEEEHLEEEAVEEEEPRKLKTAKYKLFIAGTAGGLILILIIAGLILLIGPGKKKVDQVGSAEPVRQKLLVNMKPFIIDFSSSGQDVILKLTMSLTFSSPEAEAEFKNQQVVMRDLIYRFLQGHASVDLNKRAALLSLQKDIARLINSALTRGQVNMVLFQELLLV
ncbi:MAG: flagellar basal body-associated FliL family protein [Deltaproteobacteria bacterium]|nr:flagellar basal body-associated FliL family protein [Deltaproteobacteria bacterium]MBW2084955.1 flagellar basal body-associated FliL family protein [Deltaproteobacteria bacterium]